MMTKERELITYIDVNGSRSATIIIEESYILSYRVELCSNEKLIGTLFFKNEDKATEMAKAFAFWER